MRAALNAELSNTISSQFEAMREDLRLLQTRGDGIAAGDLSAGFDRLTRELGVVASRVEHNDAASLRSEVEELKAHVAELAREDTLRDMTERWSVIEQEIGALPETLGSRDDLMGIADRISQIDEAMSGLPNSRAMESMEDQVRALAEAVATLASQNAAISPDYLTAIDERLDEISRAIVAVSVSSAPPEIDPTPFDRIEARLSSLARQIEEQGGDSSRSAVDTKLAEIGARLDALHSATANMASPDDAFDKLSDRLEEVMHSLQDGSPPASVPDEVLDRLNSRFEEIASRLDSHHSSAEQAGARMFQSLDARMEELARRIEENERDSASVPTFDHMERRIEEIAQMLTSGEGQVSAPPGGADPDAFENLEAQIAALSERLSAMPAPVDNHAVADLAPKLIAIGEQFANGREEMISAAREAAEEIVTKFAHGASEQERDVLGRLAADLHALDELARNADDRNVRTFEAIHDTLVKVADRIAGLEEGLARNRETGTPAAAAAPAPVEALPEQFWSEADKKEIDDAPAIDIADDGEVAEPPRERDTAPPRMPVSPAEAAALAAGAAASPADAGEGMLAPAVETGPGDRKSASTSILGNLRNRLNRSTAEPAAETIEDEVPEIFGKAHSSEEAPEVADEPLEPGSGGPDLAAIMKRVRAERSGAPDADSADEAGKSDFIAAARRAARAAADEAAITERPDQPGRNGKKSRAEQPRSRRPLMLGVGAILLALMAIPLVRNVLLEDNVAPVDVVAIDEKPSATETESPSVATEGPEPGQSEASASPDAAPQVAAEAPVVVREAVPVVAEESEEVSSDAPAPVVETDDPEDAAGQSSLETLTLDDVPEEIGPVALREAVVAGDPKAMFVVGDRMMINGPAAPDSDLEGAARWYEMAAELGYAPAQYRIGNFYEKGHGLARDADAAKTWYQLAAEQGNASAMHNLAVLFATEINGKRDMASAGRWFLEAAELGVRDSQVNLGILSARGEGVAQDLVESYKWLALAAAAGDADALAKRDEVATFMRPDQLETARGRVELWKPKPVDPEVNTVEVPDAWKTDKAVTAASATISGDDMTRAIRNIQAILNQNGFDAGPPDGIMGNKTRAAIIEFQKANGLMPTGEVDRALVDKLLEHNRTA